MPIALSLITSCKLSYLREKRYIPQFYRWPPRKVCAYFKAGIWSRRLLIWVW